MQTGATSDLSRCFIFQRTRQCFLLCHVLLFLSSEHHCGLRATAALAVPQISADMFSDVGPTPDGGHG